ncbi:hypothetical protein ABZ318_39400, partial [Streptomyces sp. NPDC006197]|uniref:hypothetical protein n=1 Tax=Streptomyces sp. NPDC006197 TaxID=3156685 RepID=UPI0033A13B90
VLTTHMRFPRGEHRVPVVADGGEVLLGHVAGLDGVQGAPPTFRSALQPPFPRSSSIRPTSG